MDYNGEMGARKHAAWALGLLCAITLPASARAGAWLPPAFDLSTNGFDAGEVHVAMDSAGDALAVWVRNGVVQSSFRPAGGANSFSVAADMPGAAAVASHLRVAMDAGGDAVAVWQTDGGSIQAAYMPQGSGGAFNSAQTLETDGTNKPTAPDVALDSAGDALAVWEHFDTGSAKVRIEDEYGPGGTFPGGPGTPISDTAQNSSNPLVRMDAAGDAVAVWLESDGAHTQVQAAARPAGNATTFGAQAQISTATANAADPALAMSSGGAAMAVWDDVTKSLLGSYSSSAGSAFGSPQPIVNAAVTQPTVPSVAMNDNGDAQAVWQQSDGTNFRAEEQSAPAGTFGGTTVDVSPAGQDANEPQLAMDGAGDAVATWTNPGTQQINAAQHGSGQEFPATTESHISVGGGGDTAPSVAIDGAGDGIAGWQRSNGTNVIAQANGYDTGPQIPNLHVPGAPYAGHAVTLFAQGADVWSPTTIGWNFGDGQNGAGATVTHTYVTPGSHTATATVSAVDGLSAQSNAGFTVGTQPTASPGSLFELDSPNDCLAGGAIGCGTSLPFTMSFAYQPAVSPDNRNVYFVSLFGTVGEFARNSTTGALTGVGCLTGTAAPACTQVNNSGLNGPAAVAVSADGRNVYVVGQGDNAIVTLARNPTNGTLTWLSCIGEPGSSCANTSGKGLTTGYGVVVSPDGKNVYVSSLSDKAVAVFDRNATTGVLTQKAAPSDCISGPGGASCGVATATGMANPIGVSISPDGANVYIESGGTMGGGDVAEFSRNGSTGALSQLPAPNDQVTGSIDGTEDMAFSPDGRFAYANSFANSAIVELSRNTTGGALAQIGCVTANAGGCAVDNAHGISGALGVAVSPDGANLYASGPGAAAEASFARNPTTGLLTQLPAPFDCMTDTGSGCGQVDATGLGGARRVAVAPDGRTVYVAGQGSSALAVLRRSPATTALVLSESGAPATTTIGKSFTYTFTVTNHGPAAVANPVLSVKIPSNLSVTKVSPSQGGCSGTVCLIGRLFAGSVATVRITVTPTSAGRATTTATLTGSGEVVNVGGASDVSRPSTIVSVPPPALHKTGNVSPSKGTIRVKLPGSKRFVLLTTLRQIPFGSTIDATHGTVKVVVARRGGGTMTGYFSAGPVPHHSGPQRKRDAQACRRQLQGLSGRS